VAVGLFAPDAFAHWRYIYLGRSLAERVSGEGYADYWRLPFGIIGAVIAALVGVWLLTHVVNLTIAGDPNIYGVPIIKALIGAIVLVALWHLLTYRAWRRRSRYYRRRY